MYRVGGWASTHSLSLFYLLTYFCTLHGCGVVSTQTPSVCDKTSSLLATQPQMPSSGLLSSYLARNGGRRAAGTRSCPWSLRAAEYQRITLSIIEFPDPAGAAATGSTPGGGADDVAFPSCVVVVERTRSGSGNRSVSEAMFCGGGARRRDNLVYTSSANAIDIYINNTTSDREFLIKYEGDTCTSVIVLIDDPHSSMVFIFAGVCFIVCLSVSLFLCQAIAFKIFVLDSSLVVHRRLPKVHLKFVHQRHRAKLKITAVKSQKRGWSAFN